MKYKVVIQLVAVEEFKEARQWYKNTKVQGLSKRFANTVKATISSLQKNPTLYAIRYKNVRIIHTHKFPYAIHYFIDQNLIVITAIIYCGRDPKITINRV
jgi:mRNA-degrading endonuclease RelE of RelBE toxin-antitoxin system